MLSQQQFSETEDLIDEELSHGLVIPVPIPIDPIMYIQFVSCVYNKCQRGIKLRIAIEQCAKEVRKPK